MVFAETRITTKRIFKRVFIEATALLIALAVSVMAGGVLLGGMAGNLPSIFFFPVLAFAFWLVRAWLKQVVDS